MTATAIDVTRMTKEQVSEAGPVLARAFHDDPITVYAEPDDDRRMRILPWFFERAARYGDRWGEVYTTGSRVDGAAIWLPPGDTIASPMRMLQVGMAKLPFKAGLGMTMRFFGMMNVMEHLHKQVPADHWYLFVLGVDTPKQGQGIGGQLIAPILQRADSEKRVCYLETAKEINVTFYKKHGFEVIVDDHLPKGGPRYWTMKREPQS